MCVGLKALLTNCKCEGPSFEEKSCSNGLSTKKPSSAVLAISRDILRDRLDKTDSKLEDTRLASRQFDSPTVSTSESNEKSAIQDDKKSCQILNWQDWGSCEGACGGEGKRKRLRVCPCK